MIAFDYAVELLINQKIGPKIVIYFGLLEVVVSRVADGSCGKEILYEKHKYYVCENHRKKELI